MASTLRSVSVLCGVLGAALVAGCLTVTAPPVPEGNNWGVFTEYQPRPLMGYMAVSIGLDGYFMFDQAGAAGSSTAAFGYNAFTNYTGFWWAGDRRYNAKWHIHERTGPCAGPSRGYFEGTIPHLYTLALACAFHRVLGGGGSRPMSHSNGDQYTHLEDGDLPDIPGPSSSSSMAPDGVLLPDDEVWSLSGLYRLAYQLDGNLVIYNTNDDPVWASDTITANPGWVSMQLDGNLVVYDAFSTPMWDSGTAGFDDSYAALLDDGSLVVISDEGLGLWWSESSQWF